jgi:hypothetical protein
MDTLALITDNNTWRPLRRDQDGPVLASVASGKRERRSIHEPGEQSLYLAYWRQRQSRVVPR